MGRSLSPFQPKPFHDPRTAGRPPDAPQTPVEGGVRWVGPVALVALATRWHGTTGREPPAHRGEAGTGEARSPELHPCPHPQPRSGRAHPRQGGVPPGASWKGNCCSSASLLGLPVQAQPPRAAWGGSGCRIPRESGIGACWAPLPSRDRAGAASTRGWLGWSHPSCGRAPPEPGPGGVPVPPPGYIMARELLFGSGFLFPWTSRWAES